MISLNRVLKIYKTIMEEVVPRYLSSDYLSISDKFNANSLYNFSVDLSRIAFRSALQSPIFQSLHNLMNSTITKSLLSETAWSLAGNYDRLLVGKQVHSWNPFNYNQPLQSFIQVQNVVKINKSVHSTEGTNLVPGVWVNIIFLAGPPAGMTTNLFWSDDFVYSNRQAFGFSKYSREKYSRNVPKNPTFPFQSALELFRLRSVATIEPNSSSIIRIVIKSLKANPTTNKYNRVLLTRRERTEYTCPAGWDVTSLPCYRCNAGLDYCEAACHSKSFLINLCSICNKLEQVDPTNGNNICIHCLAYRQSRNTF